MFQDYLEAANTNSELKKRIVRVMADEGSECSKDYLVSKLKEFNASEIESAIHEMIKENQIGEIPHLKNGKTWLQLTEPQTEPSDKSTFVANYIKSMDADAMGELILRLAGSRDVSGFDEHKTKRFIYNRLNHMESIEEIKKFLDMD